MKNLFILISLILFQSCSNIRFGTQVQDDVYYNPNISAPSDNYSYVDDYSFDNTRYHSDIDNTLRFGFGIYPTWQWQPYYGFWGINDPFYFQYTRAMNRWNRYHWNWGYWNNPYWGNSYWNNPYWLGNPYWGNPYCNNPYWRNSYFYNPRNNNNGIYYGPRPSIGRSPSFSGGQVRPKSILSDSGRRTSQTKEIPNTRVNSNLGTRQGGLQSPRSITPTTPKPPQYSPSRSTPRTSPSYSPSRSAPRSVPSTPKPSYSPSRSAPRSTSPTPTRPPVRPTPSPQISPSSPRNYR